VVVLENTGDIGDHVWPRSPDGWIDLFAGEGFRSVAVHGYGYDFPLRTLATARRAMSRGQTPADPIAKADRAIRRNGGTAHRVARAVLLRPLVALSSALEAPASLLPASFAGHVAILFQREPA
jgi:hypothetical protein